MLLIGSCRLIPLAYYFHGLGQTVYRLDISKEWPDMTDILKQVDLIVCEPSLRVDFFFESNPMPDTKVYVVPNLELRMYVHDLLHVFHVKFEYISLYQAFQESRRKLSQELQDGYEALDAYIDEHLQTTKLFSSYNHPMPVLTILLFQRLAERMHLEIPEAWLEQCRIMQFLQGHDTPMFEVDRDLYQLAFIQETEPRERLAIP